MSVEIFPLSWEACSHHLRFSCGSRRYIFSVSSLGIIFLVVVDQ